MDKLDGKSMDIVSENVTKLRELFPEVFSEGKIDFQKLEEEFGQFTDSDGERYNFTWAGKSEAKRIAQTPSTGTLRPCKEESKNWDTTQNLYIEGDNLEVLKLLQKSYHKKVKMIYIDPPYNTGKDFVYKDNFHDNIKNYLEITGQVDSEGNRLSANSETNGRYHSDWLSMMYPRLKLARNLLKDDGVIFISIDDNEVANLRKLCDEIFGEDNFVAELIWQKKTGAADSVHIATITENISVFAKNASSLSLNQNTEAHDEKRYRFQYEYIETRGPFYYDNLDRGTLGYIESLDYGVETTDGTLAFPNGRTKQFNDGWRWKWGKEKLNWGLENGYIILKPAADKKCGWSVYYKIYLHVDNEGNKIIRSSPFKNLIQGILNTHAANEAKSLFSKTGLFSNPKPTDLLKHLTQLCTSKNEDDVVLDFFSGSATTAHAVMQLNSEDNGNRKFICVQLPETTDEKSEAFKAGYKNICEIGKERIRRAGDAIRHSRENGNPSLLDPRVKHEDDAYNLDIGFKVFKLDSSNIKTWDSDFEDLEQNLLSSVDNIKSDRASEDLLYEILLKYGLDLTLPIEEKSINGSKIFVIGFGALIVCLDDHIALETVKHIAKLKEEYESEITRVVFKDSSFSDAVVKTNALQTLKQFGIDEVVSI